MNRILQNIGVLFREIFLVTKEEYSRIFKDKGVLMIFIIASFTYPLIYGWVYKAEVVKEVPVAIVNEDHSKLSRDLIRMTDATEQVNVTHKVTDISTAEHLFHTGEVSGIIIIDSKFSKSIFRGEQATISVYSDASYFMFYKQVLTGVNYAAGTLGTAIQVQRRMARGEMMEQAIAKSQAVELVSIPLFNPTGGYASYLMPGVLVLVLQQVLLMGIGLLGGTTNEKSRSHSIEGATRSIRGAFRLIVGKTLAYTGVYLFMAYYLFFVVFRMFQFPSLANPIELCTFMLPYIISVVLLGLFLSSFFKKRENSLLFIVFTAVPLLFVSGVSWPIEKLPLPLFYFGKIIPSTHGILGMYRMNVMGGNLHTVLPEYTALWGLCLLFFTLCLYRFHAIVVKEK